MEKKRCAWCEDGGMVQAYHDTEWGVPLHDDQKQFEYLMMEVMQCGLNWALMLKKRQIFRQCFAEFDYERVAAFAEADIARILHTEGMIRSPRKIAAVIENARAFLRVRAAFGSFADYLWQYSDNRALVYPSHQRGQIPAQNPLSA